MRRVASTMGVGLWLAACGGDDGAGPVDGAVDDAAVVDATPIDAVDARPACVTVDPGNAPRVRRAVGLRARGELAVYAERGGTFRKVFVQSGLGHFLHAAWGDLDGDGFDELASEWFTLPDGNSAGVQVFGDRGSGIALLQRIAGGPSWGLQWLRADGDRRDDLWMQAQTSGRVSCSDGARLVDCWQQNVPHNSERRMAAGDLDHDGLGDVAFGAFDGLTAYRNVGGQFAQVLRVPGMNVEDLDWVELDGCEGHELVFTVSPIGQPRTWQAYRWHAGELVAYPLPPIPPLRFDVTWGDFDGDGDDDPLVCEDGPGMRLYRRDGEALTMVRAFDNLGCAAAWGDFDADGDLDLAYEALQAPDAALAIMRNDGDGTFTSVARIVGIDTSAIAWGRCGPDPARPCFPLNDLPP